MTEQTPWSKRGERNDRDDDTRREGDFARGRENSCASHNFEVARLSDARRARGRLPGPINILAGQEFPKHELFWGKGAAVQEDSSLPKILSKRAGQALLERADIGWPREQADTTRDHLLEEEEGGGKGPNPLTII